LLRRRPLRHRDRATLPPRSRARCTMRRRSLPRPQHRNVARQPTTRVPERNACSRVDYAPKTAAIDSAEPNRLSCSTRRPQPLASPTSKMNLMRTRPGREPGGLHVCARFVAAQAGLRLARARARDRQGTR
jgi:hypothetical protein